MSKPPQTREEIFGQGVPTAIDVEKLMPLVADYKEGDLIPWAVMEAAIGEKRKTNRFRTVTAVWRRRLYREKNWVTAPVSGEGVKILTHAERPAFSKQQVVYGTRRIYRAANVAAATDPAQLDEEGRKLRDHVRMLPALLMLAEKTAPREITV